MLDNTGGQSMKNEDSVNQGLCSCEEHRSDIMTGESKATRKEDSRRGMATSVDAPAEQVNCALGVRFLTIY